MPDEYEKYEKACATIRAENEVWFIKKAMWASPTTIKSNAASLKTFYASMCERGDVNAQDVADLRLTIRENMEEWIATVQRYDDPDITDMNEVWGF